MQAPDLTRTCTTVLEMALQRASGELDDPIMMDVILLGMSEIYSREAIIEAVRTWCSLVVANVRHGHLAAGADIDLIFQNETTGELTPSTPHILAEWSGRLLAARFAADDVTFYMLANKIPTEARRITAWLIVLVSTCAATIHNNTHPRPGFISTGLHARH
jgi:hypothetical protein